MASTYLTRTPSTAGNRKTWTMSYWVKRSILDSNNIMFQTLVSTYTWCRFDGSQRFEFQDGNGGHKVTTMKFRDTSAWYHIVLVIDTDNSTASDRYKIYVNGERITAFDTSTDPSLGYEGEWNKAQLINIGRHGTDGTYNYNGLMSHYHFIDGTAYDADTFGETDATTGIWKPKTAPSVTYGTNGFFLKFENSGAFGTDSSGNSNTFTVNGTMTQTIDTPSNVFATLNALAKGSNTTLSEGNLKSTTSGFAGYNTSTSTIGVSSGKWYWELKLGSSLNYSLYGITTVESSAKDADVMTNFKTSYMKTSYDSDLRSNTTGGAYTSNTFGSTNSLNDIVMIALDLDNNFIYMGANGTWYNSGVPTSGATGTGGFAIASGLTYFPAFTNGYSSSSQMNFGNGYFGTTAVSSAQNPDDGIGIFEYDVPTGYYALNTKAINAQEYD